MDRLIEKITDWGFEKGINNPEKQFQKLAEEMLEAHEAYIVSNYSDGFAETIHETLAEKREKRSHLVEELGDIGVVWVLLCDMLGISPLDALEAAHDKNKDRKGKTINGSFVKEQDL